ncbi:MAG: hypothetical protein QGH85_00870 [Candidatus Pacebacteria bacterium]|jgi:hypothetical protein|nr:hypothetical protein [Parcubacteria group bacterium]MDP6249462.1 hypothetical protein [Candidatus Paceibacterota bacterium]MDP7159556.1 hypothetical protein [Candidatus Paceibacterota bacterium]MDP7366275.1 hypothetical protein [Candidatus Paceibacterota bacterium]MDP7466164.1 hypothetical protein [Candidatus Paceibacterota bacterium]|tara:strand:- start:577 stop:786 length:210 start_codon:yes stop_codon:yes gene_type:complete
MESVKKLTKITIILVFIAFAGQFVYINIILPSPFRNELKTCINNSQKLNDSMAVKIAEELCFDVYPHFN